MKFLFTILLLPFTLWGQTWTDPINISPNLPGLDNQPDLCIDKDGTLHCVFTHKLDNNWRKIYYSKSTNDGATWTTPEDISLNPDTSLMNPHIVADTNNKLYVTYDYNTMNPAATLIKLKTFDGNQWSTPFIVSEGMYNSDYNLLCIDHSNRVYVFWGYLDQWSTYRYFENGQWSEIFSLYYNQLEMQTMSVVVDSENNLHCVGWGIDNGGPYAIYFSYLYDWTWSDWTIISPQTDFGSAGGGDIDLNNNNLPEITYRQKTYGTPPYNDSTMYTFFNGSNWSEPELVVNDPYEQKIAIDPYNRLHIIDREKLETGYKLVHYRNVNNFWQGYILDESDIVVGNPQMIEKNNILYLVYYECYSNDDCRIKFTKNYLTTAVNNKFGIFNELNIYPNPFKTQTSIEFELNSEKQIDVSIYNLNGQKIKTLINENKKPGWYRLIWNGKGLNGKEVKNGLYLVRLQWGRNIITKPVEYVK